MRVLVAWLAVAASDPVLPAAQTPAATPQAPKSAPPGAAAGTEVGEVVVIAPRPPPEPDWSRKLNLDVRNRYGGSDIPYLRQRPTNGCKIMAGGTRSPSGHPGAAGGLVCAKSF